jgi:outer membrane receptor protein involved in Fe transport
VPINLFGEGRPSEAALDYVNRVSWVKSKAAELVLLAYMGGDTSEWFSLPGGPVRFVIGGEDRYETAHQRADPVSANFGTFFNAFSVFDPPKLNVKEVFGELEFPILRDMPFAHELTVNTAARYSDYNTNANTTFAWNASAVYAPVRDIRFRGNYSKSVRVPTQGDLFTPATQNFAFVSDPCDVNFIGNGTTNRPINCANEGIPVGFINTPARSFSTEFISQGNPDLVEETGKSWTFGFVATPRWVPGLSISVDYYRITVSNLISFLSAQAIVNACYDLPQPNQFCDFMFPRNPDFTFGAPAVLSQGVNFAKLRADGIDGEIAYRKTFANGHKLNVHGVVTYVINRDNFIDPSRPEFKDQQLKELGDPQWAANLNLGYDFGRVGLNWSMNYIGKQTIGAYENYFGLQDRPPQNADLTAERWYPDRLYHAARIDFRVPQGGKNKFNFYVGVDNIFDSKPPLGLLGVGAGDPFDSIGRYFYGGATIDF